MTSLSYKVSTSPPLPTPPPDEDDESSTPNRNFLPPPPPPRRLARTPPPPPPFQPRRGSVWDFVKSEATGAWDSVGSLTRSKEGVESFHPTDLPLEAAKAARILRSFTMETIDLPIDNPTPEQQQQQAKKAAKVMKKIPPSAMEHCQGLAIFTVMRTGFLVSGAGGSGVVLARLPDGTWSPPSGILIHTIGFGVVSGADVYDVVLLLRTTKAVKSFSYPRLTLGGELAISQGPWDLGANGAGLRVLETGVEISPVWSYVKSKSSYGGVQVDGNVVIERNDENERSYGKPVTSLEILDGQVAAPSWASGLHQTILAAEGKDFSPALIPIGTSPSEGLSPSLEGHVPSSSSSVSSSSNNASPSILSVRRTSSSTSSSLGINSIRKLPQEDLDDEDLQAQREMEAMLKEFGIENPNINKELREVDPLLVRGKSHSNEGSQKTSFIDHTPPLTPPQAQREATEGNKSLLGGYSMEVEKTESKEGPEGEEASMAGLGLTGVEADRVSIKSDKAESVKSAKGSIQSSPSTRASLATAPEKAETSAAEEPEEDDVPTPTETEKEQGKAKEAVKPNGKPVVPPRRSPKVAQETRQEEDTKVEKDGEEDEDEEEDNFETPVVEQE